MGDTQEMLIRMPRQMHSRLRSASFIENVSMSAIVREAIERELGRREEAHPALFSAVSSVLAVTESSSRTGGTT